MPDLAQDRQSESLGELVTLFELDATDLGAPTVYYFTNTVLPDTTEIIFGGNTYTYIDIQAVGFEVTGDSEQPQPSLTLGLINPVVRQTLRDYGDLLGASLTRKITLKKHLDGQPSADSLAFFGANKFILDQKSEENKRFVEWNLATPMDHLDLKLPQGIMTKRYCSLIYRFYNTTTGQFDYTKATCPHVGASFDKDGNSVPDAQDVCNKQITGGCKVRFVNEPLPINIYAGLGEAN